MDSEQIQKRYAKKKVEIQRRMGEFRNLGRKASKDELFAEIAYCICTPMNHFTPCQNAIYRLQETRLLFSEDEGVIAFYLLRNKVRFHNVKAKHIIQAREKLFDKECPNPLIELIKEILSMPQRQARNHLNDIWIPGLGMKESSHFLRNVGHGDELAILDRHILGNLVEFGVVPKKPKTLNPTNYQMIEEKMSAWSKQIGIPLGELDLLLWSEETGEIFK